MPEVVEDMTTILLECTFTDCVFKTLNLEPGVAASILQGRGGNTFLLILDFAIIFIVDC